MCNRFGNMFVVNIQLLKITVIEKQIIFQYLLTDYLFLILHEQTNIAMGGEKWMKKLFILFAITGLLISCTKNSLETEDTEATQDTETERTPQFYYVGYSYHERYQEQNRRAILSIGDSIVPLSPDNRSDALAIHVHNGIAHITGYQNSGSDRRVVYWKDNEISRLSDPGSNNAGTAILATEDQVLIGGDLTEDGRTYQYLWIDKTPHRKAGALMFSGIKSIAVDNSRIFLAGDFAQRATMWDDNSTLYALSGNASGGEHIAFRNGEPYIIGWEVIDINTDAVTVWKNREKIFSHTLGFRTYGITALMHGSDYYYTVNSAESDMTSRVYKNDQLLYQLAEGQDVVTTAIRIHQDKVYVLGQILEGNSATPTLWVDGQPQALFSAEDKICLHDFFIY